MLLQLFGIVSLLVAADAHLRLTFPPAREYQLDFLDNFRTTGPCGMPYSGMLSSNNN